MLISIVIMWEFSSYFVFELFTVLSGMLELLSKRVFSLHLFVVTIFFLSVEALRFLVGQLLCSMLRFLLVLTHLFLRLEMGLVLLAHHILAITLLTSDLWLFPMLTILAVCMMLVMRVGRLVHQGVAVDEIVVLGLVVVIVSVVGFGGVEVIIRG